ncbi:hypothetical protein HDU83_002501 [Entophlyctis luteolus]|nr:hypothetical protein HDU83_002501 [Entophlyctis luteolus]
MKRDLLAPPPPGRGRYVAARAGGERGKPVEMLKLHQNPLKWSVAQTASWIFWNGGEDLNTDRLVHDILVQALLFDRTDPEGAARGRDVRAIAAPTVDPSRLGGGGQGHSISVMGRKLTVGNSGPLYTAIEDFVAQQPGDLEFQRGDTIEYIGDGNLSLYLQYQSILIGTVLFLLEVDTNWGRGRINGREGIFPRSFVQKR